MHFLFKKYLDKTCTKEELAELLELSQQNNIGQHLTGELKKYWESLDTDKLQDEVDWATRYESIIEIRVHFINIS